MRPVIIGGSPGCGKTTLCAHLARSNPMGVHIQTDHFFHFLANVIDPSKPEAHMQNNAVIDAYCSAANSFTAAGYSVYIDGVIGPWHHQLITSALGPFDDILLHAPLELTLSRIAARKTQSSAHPSLVERMHPQFESVLKDYSANLVPTHSTNPRELADAVLSKIRTGECEINAA